MAKIKTKIKGTTGSYESYLYRYTHVETGRKYLGIHKGKLNDRYNHSSKNEEFNKLLRDPNEEFLFEVLAYGSYHNMRNKEYKMLSEVDAKNNTEYFNQSNGSPINKGTDKEKVRQLFEKIKNGYYTPEMTDAEQLLKSIFEQARVETDRDHKLDIQGAIDDAHGDTQSLELLAVMLDDFYEEDTDEYGFDGSHGIGGNHSTQATNDSKHGVDLPTVRIPAEDYADFTTSEIAYLANMLNAPDSVIDPKTNEDETLIKYIMTENTENDLDAMSDEMQDLLVGLKVPKRKAKLLMKQADKRIAENILNMSGKTLIDWESSSRKKQLQDKIKNMMKTGDTLVYTVSSGMVNITGLLHSIKEDMTDDIKSVITLVRHPAPSYLRSWHANRGKRDSDTIEFFLEPRNVSFEFVDLPHEESDKKFRTMEDMA